MCPKNENKLDTPRTKRQFIFSVDGIHCSHLRSYSGKQQLLLGISDELQLKRIGINSVFQVIQLTWYQHGEG